MTYPWDLVMLRITPAPDATVPNLEPGQQPVSWTLAIEPRGATLDRAELARLFRVIADAVETGEGMMPVQDQQR